jgi:transcriptional regulator with AAA-type ATPase domain
MVFGAEDRAVAGAVRDLVYENPFLPARLAAERAALGADFDPAGTLWQARDEPTPSPNERRLGTRVAALLERARPRLASGAPASPEALSLYEALVLYRLYDRAEPDLYRLAIDDGAATRRVAVYKKFREELDHWTGVRPGACPTAGEAPHLFACFFQVRRAFHHIFANILGTSGPALQLRAAVWQSIFTHDARRYRRGLFARMGDLTTLIQGPSGTGKELVARAIALSRYVPFDPASETFAEAPASVFFPLHLAALSPTLIEAELFGHRRGAFTGALEDRKGWFEVCPPLGTVFLDEIGEVEPAIQVKLLRVLQTRTFQRLGETQACRFPGKLIAATNRDLATEIEAGRFREDFYYRLCSDVILTPSLAERLLESPGELRGLLEAIARRVAGDGEASALADEAETWITKHLGPDYPWPGNVRELEQCVRNILVRGHYRPRQPRPAATARTELVQAVLGGTLTADELVRRYCTLVYAETGSYSAMARRLGLDRRTARGRVDPAWLAALRPDGEKPRRATRRGRS